MSDTYDGMNPSDNPQGATALPEIEAEIVEPVIEQAVYAVLTVWPLTKEADVYSYGAGSMNENARHVQKWNAGDHSGKAYLIRVPIPSVK